MNARAQDAALAFADNPEARSFTPVMYIADYQRFHEDEICADVELYAAWIEAASAVPGRKASKRFPIPISTQELHALQYGRVTTLLERALCCEELRERFLEEQAHEINDRAKRAMDQEEQRARHREASEI